MEETQVDERGEGIEMRDLKDEMIMKEVHIEQVVEYLPQPQPLGR